MFAENDLTAHTQSEGMLVDAVTLRWMEGEVNHALSQTIERDVDWKEMHAGKGCGWVGGSGFSDESFLWCDRLKDWKEEMD